MSASNRAILTPRPVPFRYQRLPTLEMPVPNIPENTEIPKPGVHEVFELRVATTRSISADAYAIRWQVYCQEFGYEPAHLFPDQQETDAADHRSVQVVAYYRPTGRPVGCFRLLLTDPLHLDTPFHLEEVCPELIPRSIPRTGERRLGYAEISRYCILAPFRRFTRRPPSGVDEGQWLAEEPMRRGLATLMWFAAAHLAVHIRLDYILALMEPRLCQLARSWGFCFLPIGAGVDFHGLGLPYRIDRRSIQALLSVPDTAALLAPFLSTWNEQAQQHPLLYNYLEQQTRRLRR